LLLIPALAIYSSAADLTIGTATAKSGQKSTGVIKVPAGVDPATDIPVVVINGARPGPILALVAGSHGTEYASIVALQKLAATQQPDVLSGALIVIPLMNLASFTQKVPHLNPVDGKNMNRLYPGKPDGTQTERISWAVAKQVVDKSDYLIDLHGGDLDENLRQYSYWPRTGKAQLDNASRAMVLAFGLDHIIIQTPSGAAVAGATSISRYATDQGKPTIIAEAGHAGTTNAEDIDALINGCTNVMRQLKMLPGAVKPVENPLWMSGTSVVRSDFDGVFFPLVTPEAYVQKGMKIGYMTDYFGKTIWEVASPISGVVVYIGAVPSMKKGDNVAAIGEIAAAP
jgi:predicted deacylase